MALVSQWPTLHAKVQSAYAAQPRYRYEFDEVPVAQRRAVSALAQAPDSLVLDKTTWCAGEGADVSLKAVVSARVDEARVVATFVCAVVDAKFVSMFNVSAPYHTESPPPPRLHALFFLAAGLVGVREAVRTCACDHNLLMNFIDNLKSQFATSHRPYLILVEACVVDAMLASSASYEPKVWAYRLNLLAEAIEAVGRFDVSADVYDVAVAIVQEANVPSPQSVPILLNGAIACRRAKRFARCEALYLLYLQHVDTPDFDSMLQLYCSGWRSDLGAPVAFWRTHDPAHLHSILRECATVETMRNVLSSLASDMKRLGVAVRVPRPVSHRSSMWYAREVLEKDSCMLRVVPHAPPPPALPTRDLKVPTDEPVTDPEEVARTAARRARRDAERARRADAPAPDPSPRTVSRKKTKNKHQHHRPASPRYDKAGRIEAARAHKHALQEHEAERVAALEARIECVRIGERIAQGQ